MVSQQQIIIATEYDELTKLRTVLPAKAFERSPARALVIIAHTLVVFVSFWLAARIPTWWTLLLTIMIAGHSLVCIGFLAHDLTHGSILGKGFLREVFEIQAWGINLISRTVWRKVHNQTHHAHFGTLKDPDRPFVDSERGFLTWVYSFLFFPNGDAVVGNPFVFVQLFFYTGRNLMAALLPGKMKPSFVPAKPEYSKGEKLHILFELVVMLGFQIGLAAATGFNWSIYIFLVVGTYSITSGLSMFYIFTNHGLAPIRNTPSILDGCTSVIVPRWVDVLHSYFSFHTEHHLFPALNPSFYPQVSRSLAEKYPGQYQRIPILKAWSLLWKRPMFDKTPSP